MKIEITAKDIAHQLAIETKTLSREAMMIKRIIDTNKELQTDDEIIEKLNKCVEQSTELSFLVAHTARTLNV